MSSRLRAYDSDCLDSNEAICNERNTITVAILAFLHPFGDRVG